MLTLLIAVCSWADAPSADWEALFDDAGWSQVATPSTRDTGTIDLRIKEIGGVPCLRGEVQVTAARDTLYATVTDLPAAMTFSSEELLASEVLATHGKTLDYYQILDVPDWTMSADRYWVLRGEPIAKGEMRGFRWTRFDWRTAYPELATRLDTEHASAVEPAVNWGAWTFAANPEGTLVRYHICADAGGSIPNWIKKAAATKTLPNTMADNIREAKRRDAK